MIDEGASSGACREFVDTVQFYKQTETASGLGVYTDADWNRLLRAYRLVVGTDVLDVGVGNGALLQVLARSNRFARICGIDVARHSKLALPDRAEFHIMSVASLDFAPDEFDTVVCMEVLEHLEDPDLDEALVELRRVSRRRLIMTVPYNEPLPLWWQDRPGGHRQQFTPARLRAAFPAARAVLHPRPGGTDWLFLVEDASSPPELPLLEAVLGELAETGDRATARGVAPRQPTPSPPNPEQPAKSKAVAGDAPAMKQNEDRILETYYGEFGTHQAQEHARDRINWMMAQASGEEVLDVGCSQGLVALLLGRAGFRVHGIDIRPSAIEFANAQLAREAPAVQALVRFSVSDVRSLASSTAGYDTVVLGEVLEHQTHPQRVLDAVAAVVRPGGRIVVTVPFGFHPDPDHKQTLYLSDLRALVGAHFQLDELFVQHGFICCVAHKPADGAAPRADDEARFETLLKTSEASFLRIEKARRADTVLLKRTLAETDRKLAAAQQGLRTAKRELADRDADLARARSELRALHSQVSSHDGDPGLPRAVRERLRNTEQALETRGRIIQAQRTNLQEKQAALANLLDAPRYRLGDLLLSGLRQPWQLPALPVRLLGLARSASAATNAERKRKLHARRRATLQTRPSVKRIEKGASEPRAATGNASSAVASKRAVGSTPAAAAAVPRAVAAATPAKADAQGASKPQASLVHRVEHPELPVTIACILDEFSWENLRHECELYRLPGKGWRDRLQAQRPDMLLVESAWNGNDGEWLYRITYNEPKPDNPLFKLLDYCRNSGIPTVFWNKEDPPNYDRFIDAARRFDYIFTTDVNCIAKYEQDAPSAKLGVLPFAAQPAIQNPINREKFEKLGDICFAGAWYPRHPERFEDAKNLLDASRGFDVVIYDRYFNHPAHDRYKFPDEFQHLIRGSLGFEEMVEKYRQFDLFLNVNSVKDSPTMFSRRVLELLACGTPVVSGYAEGIAALLGEDVVPMCRTVDEAQRVIEKMLTDSLYRDATVLKGQRKIFAEHTYRHRLRHICDTLGIALGQAPRRLSVLTATIRRRFIDSMLENFARQTYGEKDLLVIVNAGSEVTRDFVEERARALEVPAVRVIEVPASSSLGTCLNIGMQEAEGAIFAKMDDDDYYGEHYLEDSVLALDYSGADCVGKQTYFTYAEGRDMMYVQRPARQHTMTSFVMGTTLVGHRSVFPDASFGDTRVGEDTIFLKRLEAAGKTLYSHSKYNYVKFYARALEHHTWKVEEEAYLKDSLPFCGGFRPDKVCF